MINYFLINKNIQLLSLTLLKNNLFKKNNLNNINYIAMLEKLSLHNNNLIYLILNKLNINSTSSLNYLFKTYYYYLFK